MAEEVVADEWYQDCAPECLGITAEATDAEIEEIARKEEGAAENDGYIVIGIEEYLRQWRAVFRFVEYIRDHGMPDFSDIPAPTGVSERFLSLSWEPVEGVVIKTNAHSPYPPYITVTLEDEWGNTGWKTVSARLNTTLGHKAAVVDLANEIMEQCSEEEESE